MNINNKAIIIKDKENPPFLKDNIAAALRNITSGEMCEVNNQTIQVCNDVAQSKSFAVEDIDKGNAVISSGVQVATAKYFIQKGHLIDPGKDGNILHKVDTAYLKEYGKCNQKNIDTDLAQRTFLGYKRDWNIETKYGTRNYVAILNTVKCSLVTAQNIAHNLRVNYLKNYSNVDDVVIIENQYGCGMPKGKALDELIKLVANALNNPNISSICLLGLGCEHLCVLQNNDEEVIGKLRDKIHHFDKRVWIENVQNYKSEMSAIDEISNSTMVECLEYANMFKREILPVSCIRLGLKCGGSDRLSGIAANPVLGKAVDLLISAGGSALVTETPEFDGYMHVMAARAADKKTAEWLLNLIPRFDKLSRSYPISESGRQSIAPGNYSGGLFNIYMKSAGAASKTGQSCVNGGLEYGEVLKGERGLWMLDCPSYDQISTPALFLSGCNIAAFTTGLGTSIGSSLGPVVKIASQRKMGLNEHIDYFAEKIFEGQCIENAGEELFELIIEYASGTPVSVESLNDQLLSKGLPYRHNEFMFWKRWGDN